MMAGNFRESKMNRIIEIKLGLLLVSLAGVAILSSVLTTIIVNRSVEVPHPVCLTTPPATTQPEKTKPVPNSEWIPSNDGRKF
jgi:hypothetical protein